MDLATLHTPPPAGAGPSNRRGLAAWLLELADSDGVPLHANRVLLPLTVSALNTRLGRPPRCGTLFGRIRDLEPAVSRCTGGLVLDRAALTHEAAGVRTSSAAAQPTPPPAAAPPRPLAPEPAAEVGDALELARAACRLLDQALALIASHQATSTPDAQAAVAPRSRAGGTRESSDFAASPQQGGREIVGSSTKSPPSLTVIPRTAKAATDTGDREELTALLAPLVEICRRTGLVGVTDTPGLRRALAPYEPSQIRHAVALVSRLTKAGSIKASPVGWLVAKARDGDTDYFPDATAAAPPPPTSVASAHVHADPMLETAERAVAAAGADELAALDEWIRTAPHHGRIRHLIFDRPEMLQTARVEAWRALRKEAS